jgi:LysM repeat protein
LQIPASTAAAPTGATRPAGGATTAATGGTTAAASGDATVYVVKSGDVLLRIAKAHNTTVKAIEQLNDMKTSAIKAGQKIKVPVMRMASAETTPPSATPIPAAPVPVTPARTY